MSENHQHQSQAERDRKKAKQRQIVVISTVLVVVLIAAIVAIVFKNQQAGRQEAAHKPATHKTEKAVHIQYDGHPVTGRSNAPVKIAEFADYRCPYCKQFEEKIVPKLKKDYIEPGKASFYFMNDTILGQGSVLAANAADEIYHQNPKAFWNFHQELYKEQGDENKQWVTKSLLTTIAQKTVPSLDVKAFQSSLDTLSHKNDVEKDNDMADALGVKGTPTVFVNGKMIDNPFDYGKLTQAIDQALKGK